MQIQIPGTSLVRDTNTMALINKDQNGLNDYLKKRQMMAIQKEEINNVKQEIQSVKNDMCEIKQLLMQLLEKK
jgi:ubiquinone biosynthesis protein UbiJ